VILRKVCRSSQFYGKVRRLTKFHFLTVTPGQANYVLDGSSEDDVTLNAWHITFADYGKLTNVLAKQPGLVVSATLNPTGTFPFELIKFRLYR
jgi:hypothetical protein